jgi:hypothetical protein
MSAQTATPSADPSTATAQSSNDSQGTADAQEAEVPATGYVNRPAAPRHAANATGDSIVTDGIMTVVRVGSSKTPAAGPPQLNTR